MSTRQHSRKTARQNSTAHNRKSKYQYGRTLRYESLEDRRLLAVVTVTTLADTVDFNDGKTSLREAIFATNTVQGADTINFASSLTAGSSVKILLTGGELAITDALTINGPSAGLLTIDAQQLSRIFNVTAATGDYSISDLSLTGGKTTSAGGAIRSVTSGSLTLNNCVVDKCQTTGANVGGGGVFSAGPITLVGTTISNNKAVDSGGGILAQHSTVVLNNSIVSGNSTSGSFSPGGGIYAGTLTINHCGFAGNSTSGSFSPGGGMYANSITITQSTISGNTTTGSFSPGGGAYAKNTVSVTSSDVSGNSTGLDSSGGGISSKGTVNLTNSTVSGNNTFGGSSSGGGIYSGSSLTVTSSSIIGNNAYDSGGGIYAKSSAVISSSTITGNLTTGQAAAGGGIYGRASMTVSDCQIIGNRSQEGGGGIRLYGAGTLTLVRDTISGNQTDVWGGGVVSGGMTVSECTISENQAYEGGGIYCNGSLTIRNSSITGNIASGYNGGGISSYGQLSLSNSTVSGNETTRNGGGIYCYGDVSIENSTISNNSATLSGGGITATKSIHLLNSTVSQNTASLAGGIWCRGPSATISQSTVFANQSAGVGGGVFMDSGALSLDGAIVAGNYAQSGTDVTGLLGASIHARFSLIGNNSGSGLASAPVGSPDANGNIIGGSTYQSTIDAELGPLADNGGPTKTHAVLLGSPALNNGDPNAIAGASGLPQFDQRGVPLTRVFGGRIDMGAYERQTLPFVNYVVDSLADENDGDISIGHLSLREAIGLANADVGSVQVISFAQSLTAQGPAIILLTREDLTITDPLTINGPGADLLTIDAGGNDIAPQSGKGSRVFSIDDGDSSTTAVFSISGLTLTGGDVADGGGAILSRENLAVAGSSIRDNFATTGGGIYSSAPLALINCSVSGNAASGDGGGICNNYANTTLTGCTITANSALQRGGGGIRVFGSRSTTTLNDCVLSDNTAADFGGGIYTYGPVILNNDVVARNVAQGGGGVLTFKSATVTNSLIAQNKATLYSGGGLQVGGDGGGLTVFGSTIVANSANSGSGGGIVTQNRVTITNSTLSDNSALQGGAIYCSSGSNPVTIAFSTIVSNVAASPSGKGGGILLLGNSLNLNGSIVAMNSGASGPDISLGPTVKSNIAYSLIGDKSGTSFVEAPLGSPDAKGNLIGGPVHGVIDPKVSPIAYNGGPTFLDGSQLVTRAPLSGSPAINAGDPAAVAGTSGVPVNDQRGAPFTRVYGGRIDIGAFELQPTGGLVGDFNRNGIVDAGDYVIGRKQGGSIVVPGSGADANGDGKVNDADLVVWRSNFGAVQDAATASAVQQLSKPELAIKSLVASGQVALSLQVTSRDASNVPSGSLRLAVGFDAEVSPLTKEKTPKAFLSRSITNNDVARIDLAIEAWLATRASDDNKHSLEARPPKLNPVDCTSDAIQRRASLDDVVDDALVVL